MKFISILLTSIFILFSCSKIIDRSQLIGNWYLKKVNGYYGGYSNSTYLKDNSPFFIYFYDNLTYKSVQNYKDNNIEITAIASGKYNVDYAITYIEFIDSEINYKIKGNNFESNIISNISYSFNDCYFELTNLTIFDSLYTNYNLIFEKF